MPLFSSSKHAFAETPLSALEQTCALQRTVSAVGQKQAGASRKLISGVRFKALASRRACQRVSSTFVELANAMAVEALVLNLQYGTEQ